MAVSPHYSKYMDTIQQGMMPNLKKQRAGMYDYLLQLSQRQGVGSAMQNVAKGMAPYAEEAGQAAAQAGVRATEMSQKQEQFETQQSAWEKNREQQQSNWEKSFSERQNQQNMVNMMNIFQQTGTMTPEMMDAFGFGDMSRSQQRDIQSQLEMLGMGGSGGGRGLGGVWQPGKNPAVDRLYGGGGGSNFGSGGASSRSISTPSDPFRRVTGPGQGPGLMKFPAQ
jgi:hypothetical protein